jgi:hypothetical protein
MVARAARNYPALRFQEADAENLPFEDRCFDYAVCAYGLMHLQNPDAAIFKANRILKPGGIRPDRHHNSDHAGQSIPQPRLTRIINLSRVAARSYLHRAALGMTRSRLTITGLLSTTGHRLPSPPAHPIEFSMITAVECRELAIRCRNKAARQSSPRSARLLRKIAASFSGLASQLDLLDAHGGRLTNEDTPETSQRDVR